MIGSVRQKPWPKVKLDPEKAKLGGFMSAQKQSAEARDSALAAKGRMVSLVIVGWLNDSNGVRIIIVVLGVVE